MPSWTYGKIVLIGDAAHPVRQSLKDIRHNLLITTSDVTIWWAGLKSSNRGWWRARISSQRRGRPDWGFGQISAVRPGQEE